MSEFKANQSLFREMNAPFENLEAANSAVEGFYKDVEEARKRHKIPTVLIVVHVCVLTESGEEGNSMTHGGYGDALKFESLAAYALGMEQRLRQERIAAFLSGKTK